MISKSEYCTYCGDKVDIEDNTDAGCIRCVDRMDNVQEVS